MGPGKNEAVKKKKEEKRGKEKKRKGKWGVIFFC